MEEVLLFLGLSLFLFYLYDNKKRWYAERADGKFCKSCGAATYVTKIRKGYSPESGKPIMENYRSCPNIRYGYKVDTHPLSYDF